MSSNLCASLMFETSTHRLMRQEKASNVFFHLRAPPFVCLPWVDTLSFTWWMLPGLPPPFVHIASNQKLDDEKAWKRGCRLSGCLFVYNSSLQDLPTVIGDDRVQPVFSTNQLQLTPSQSLLYFVHCLEWLPILFANRTLSLNLGITLATIWIAAAALCFSLSSHHVTTCGSINYH